MGRRPPKDVGGSNACENKWLTQDLGTKEVHFSSKAVSTAFIFHGFWEVSHKFRHHYFHSEDLIQQQGMYCETFTAIQPPARMSADLCNQENIFFQWCFIRLLSVPEFEEQEKP